MLALTAIFSIVDPFGVVPTFITLSQGKPKEWQFRMCYKASINTFLILTIFMFFGTEILSFFSITVHGMRIAGGIMICMNAIHMLQGDAKEQPQEHVSEDKVRLDISFTPLSMPLLAGPGSISLVIGLYYKAQTTWQVILLVLAIAVTALSTFLVLRSANYLSKWLGQSGIAAMTKITGFFVLAIGIEFIINGIKGEFHWL